MMIDKVKFAKNIVAVKQKEANAMKPGAKKKAALKDIAIAKKIIALTINGRAIAKKIIALTINGRVLKRGK